MSGLKIAFPGPAPEPGVTADAAATLEFVANLVERRVGLMQVPAGYPQRLPEGAAGISARDVADVLLGALVMLNANLPARGREGLQENIREILVFMYDPAHVVPGLDEGLP